MMEPERSPGFDPVSHRTPTSMLSTTKTIAIVGFPGVGKTLLARSFAQSGAGDSYRFLDLPGVHMLGRSTEAEREVYDELLGRTERGVEAHPDGIVVLIDATGLERQLYLASQVIDLRLPVLMYIVRLEEARRQGLHVDVDKLSMLLGIDVMPESGGPEALLEKIVPWFTLDAPRINVKPAHWRPSIGLADAYNYLDRKWIFLHLPLHTGARLIEGLRLIGAPRAVEDYSDHPAFEALQRAIEAAREKLTDRSENWTMAEVWQRHGAIQQIIQASVRKETQEKPPPSRGWFGSLWRRLMSVF